MSPSSRSIPASEELRKLYESIGFALAQWQFVEAELGRLLVILVRSENGAANSSFFAINSFSSKMRMVDTAAQQVLIMNKLLLCQWDGIYRKLERHRRARNNLAHFSVVVRGDLERHKHVYYLEPTWFDIGHIFDEKPSRYNFEDVKHLGFEFDNTSREIATFSSAVGKLSSAVIVS